MNNKKLFNKILLLFSLVIFIFTAPTKSNADVLTQHSTSESTTVNLIVLFKNETIDSEVKNFIVQNKGEIKTELSEVGTLEIECDASLVPKIKNYSSVQSLTPNNILKIPKEKTIPFKESKQLFNENQPADLYDMYQWDIKRITNNGDSFSLETGNHDVVVGIIDSGVDIGHYDLKDNLLGGENLVPKNFQGDSSETGDITDFQDRLGHGTFVTGAIAANGRTKGVAPDIGFRSYRIFDSQGVTDETIISSAIIKATDDGVKVINLSITGYNVKGKCYWTDPETGETHIINDDMEEYSAYKRAIKYAMKNGVTVVSAAGNDSLDCSNNKDLTESFNKLQSDLGFSYKGKTYVFPGSIKGVINVSATGKSDKISAYSNYGSKYIDVAAPGGDYFENYSIFDMCISTSIGDYWFIEGTSIAAPKVSAIAALIICQEENISPKKVAKKIYRTSESIAGDNDSKFYGSGLSNAYNALSR